MRRLETHGFLTKQAKPDWDETLGASSDSPIGDISVLVELGLVFRWRFAFSEPNRTVLDTYKFWQILPGLLWIA